VTVRAYYLALRDLARNRTPGPIAESPTYCKLLVPQVVELQNNRIGLPAVDTGVARQEVEEQMDVGCQ